MNTSFNSIAFLSSWLEIDFTLGILGIIAVCVTAIAALVMVLSFIGGGDFDGDAGLAGAEGGLFSLRAIIGFLLGLSWGAFVARTMGVHLIWSLVIGAALGMATFFVIALTMRMLFRLHTDGTFQYESLAGMDATVYLTIPPRGEAGGQVQVSHPNQFITIAAVQEGETPLAAHSRVTILRANSTQVVVKATV